jgi:3-hydroxyacyl-CoA dehydrogenase / enoyl-CoA hydratase / 3-hydroxybutyryl-CoA epimerase
VSEGGDRNIRTVLENDGVLVATIDMPERSMNVFSAGLMDSLEGLLQEVGSRSDIRAVILRSGKPAFLAGADLEMVRKYTESARVDSPAELHKLCGRLGRLFRRLETNGKPFVAALHGLALGGGLELALACHECVAAEDAQVGLPEIKLGLLPGAGGTQRLPRLIGQKPALEMMLRGEPVSAARAHELGIIDVVVPADALLEEARRRATALVGREARAPWDRNGWSAPVRPDDFGEKDDIRTIAQAFALGVDEYRHYPAYEAIVACVTGGASLPMDAACSWEMDCFVRLIRDPSAGNMIRSLFLDRQRASKLLAGGASKRPARATVIGTQTAEVRALLKSARVEIVDPASLASDGVTIVTSMSDNARPGSPDATVAWLRGLTASPQEVGAHTGVWVSDATTYGRAVEICVGTEGAAVGAALQVALWFRATPLMTPETSLFHELASAQSASSGFDPEVGHLAIALAAARVWSTGVISDTGVADSAAVVAGFLPAYTGGPFTYLSQRGAQSIRASAAKVRDVDASLFAVPDELEALVAACPT